MNPFRWPIGRSVLHKLIVALMVVLGLQLLRTPFYKIVVNEVFNPIDWSGNLSFIAFCTLLLLLLIRVIYSITKESIDYSRITTAGIAAMTIALYRFDLIEHPGWSYSKFSNGYRPVDLLLLFSGLTMLLLLIRLFTKQRGNNPTEQSNIHADLHITQPQEDKYEFYPAASALVQNIINEKHLYNRAAYVVGVIGGWGSGKSSFANLMAYAITRDQLASTYEKGLVVTFNPWYSRDANQIMIDFLTALRNQLSPYNPALRKEINQYISVLSELDLGLLSKISGVVLNRSTNSLQEQFEEVNQCIAELDRPIFVVIDDIDRLMSKEIMAVLQLVRNTANFKNTVFIVPYDYNYIIDTMKSEGVQNPEDYLCKIINLPYNLPAVEFDRYVETYCDIFFGTTLLHKENRTMESVKEAFKKIGFPFTPREAKRLVLSVNSTIQNLRAERDGKREFELELYDLILLESLKINNPSLHLSLYFRTNEMLTEKEDKYTINANSRSPVEYIRQFSSTAVSESAAQRQYKWLDCIFSEINIFLAPGKGHSRIYEKYFFEFYFTRSITPDFFSTETLKEMFDTAPKDTVNRMSLAMVGSERHDLFCDFLNNYQFTSVERGRVLMLQIFGDMDLSDIKKIPLMGIEQLKSSQDETQCKIHLEVYKLLLSETIPIMDDTFGSDVLHKNVIIYLLDKRIGGHVFSAMGLNRDELLLECCDYIIKFANSWGEVIIPYMQNYIHDYHSSLNSSNQKIDKIIKNKISSNLKDFVEYIEKAPKKFEEYPLNDVFGVRTNVKAASSYRKDTYPALLNEQGLKIKEQDWYKNHLEFFETHLK